MLAESKNYKDDNSVYNYTTYYFDKPVLIAEHHGIIREGIKNVLGECFSVPRVDEAKTYEEYIDFARTNEYDVIILDHNIMSDAREQNHESDLVNSRASKILITTEPGSVVNCFDIDDLSIFGYVSKSCEKNEFAFAIDSVARGRCYICPENTKHLIERCKRGNGDISGTNREILSTLSVRELEVARLIHAGMTSKEIAVSLSISPATVDRHRNNILKKLNINRSYELRKFFS